jgi:hypothetical protein
VKNRECLQFADRFFSVGELACCFLDDRRGLSFLERALPRRFSSLKQLSFRGLPVLTETIVRFVSFSRRCK